MKQEARGDVRMDALIGLLSAFAPHELDALRSRFPESAKLLDPGELAGPQEIALLQLKVEAGERSLLTALELMRAMRAHVKMRIRRKGIVDAGISAVAVVSGSALLALLGRDLPLAISYAAAVLALVSAFGALTTNIIGMSSFGTLPRIEVYRRSVVLEEQARSLLVEMRLCQSQKEGGISELEMAHIIWRGNAVAFQMNELASEEGLGREAMLGSNIGEYERKSLQELLCSLFVRPDDLRCWLGLGPDGDRIVAQIPQESEKEAYVAETLRLLEACGMLDLDFFRRLRSDFSRRSDQIDSVAGRWFVK